MPEERPAWSAIGPQIVFGLDTEGRCTLSTGPGLAALGLRPGQMVGTNLFEVYRDDPEALDSLRRVISGETFTVESDRSGRLLWVYYEPVLDSAGAVTGGLGIVTDVTDQRRAEAEVEASRDRARLAADLSAALTRDVVDPHAVMRLALRSLTDILADTGVLWSPAPGADDLAVADTWGSSGNAHPVASGVSEGGEVPPGHGAAVLTASEAAALRTPVVTDLDGHAPGDHRGDVTATAADRGTLVTALRLPIRSRGQLLGVIDLARTVESGPFTTRDVSLAAELADRCALALDNALLLEQQRRANDDLVKFRALADASPTLIAITGTDDQLLYANLRVTEVGIETNGVAPWQVITRYAGASTASELRRGLMENGSCSQDVDLSHGGLPRVVHVEAFRLTHPENGAPLGTAWIAEDVTELRTTEAALREAVSDLKQFKALVEASPDFVAIAALDGTVRYVNPGGRRLIGMDLDLDVSTTTIPDYLTPEGVAASVEIEQPAVIAEGHWEGESTLKDQRGGPPIPVVIASFLMRDPETGEPFALATVQRDLSERIAAERAVRELAGQREALLQRLVDAQEAERAQIAADVHDDPVQALTAVGLRLDQLTARLEERAPELLALVAPVRGTVEDATARLRALLFDLEPPDLRRGLVAALRHACNELFDGTSTTCEVRDEGEPHVPDVTRAVAYRIAKEAMLNARKHADAGRATVTVSARDGGLHVQVADDGVGADASMSTAPGHRGLRSMQDRAELAGGWWGLETSAGGTTVTFWLPGPHHPQG
jgi:PAS domain S-box-containing protein